MRAFRCAIVALMAAGIVAMVGAQQPTRQGRGGGGTGNINALVLSNKALQEELKITDSQKEKFKGVAEKQADLNKKRGEAFGKGGKGNFDKEKFTALQDEGKKVAEEIAKVLDTELTAEQKKRVKQISIQVMGVNVFSDPEAKGGTGGGGFGLGGFSESQKATMKEVAEALKLSDSQKSKVKEITTEFAKDRTALRKDVFGDAKGGKGNFDAEKQKDYAAKTGKLSEEVMTKVVGVFDEGQKKTWKDLNGDAFDTSKLNQGRGQQNNEE